MRAYRGISLLAIREVLYNVSFFPLAYIMKQQKSLWILEYEKNLQWHRIMNRNKNGTMKNNDLQRNHHNDQGNDRSNYGHNISDDNVMKHESSPVSNLYLFSNYWDTIAMKYFAIENLIVWRANVCAGMICSLLVVPLDIARTYYWHSSGERWNLFETTTTPSATTTTLLSTNTTIISSPSKTVDIGITTVTTPRPTASSPLIRKLSPPWRLLFRGWVPQALLMGFTFGNICTLYEWNYSAL
jgi:hypothetical protein